MSLPASVLCAMLWLVAANLRAMLPSRDARWRFAYGMIALGVPLILWVLVEAGPWVALVILLAAASILRYPLLSAGRWLQAWVRGGAR